MSALLVAHDADRSRIMTVHVVLDLQSGVSLTDLRCFMEFGSYLDDPTEDLRYLSANDRAVALAIPLTPRTESGAMRDPDWIRRPAESDKLARTSSVGVEFK